MAAIHLLRSQTSLLNSSKFKLLHPSLSSLIIYNQHDQNPNFSRQVHSITPKSSLESPLIDVNGASEEPFYESSPSGWSTFSYPHSKPTNSVKSELVVECGNGEEGSTDRVNLSSNVAEKKVYWQCAACGNSTAQWWSTCQSCNKFGTLNKISENKTSENMMKSSWLPEGIVGRNTTVRLMDVNRGINHMEWRIRLVGLLGLEVNTVLGGGVVPGSLILVGGDPGVGKSTLALQMAALIAVSCDVGGAAPVLYISGEELGVFKMSESGLEAVSNPSEMFLSEEHSNSEHLAGLAIAVIIDGSRSFLVEVQALCVSGPSSTRHVNGVQLSRADMILSVLKKQAGLKLDDHSIFLNVISGGSLTETSGDLAVAMAICSSFLEFPLPNHVAFIGEIGLGGELRMVPRIEKRVITLAKLGYKKCVVPKSARKALEAISSEIEIVGCKNLNEVIDEVFRRLD